MSPHGDKEYSDRRSEKSPHPDTPLAWLEWETSRHAAGPTQFSRHNKGAKVLKPANREHLGEHIGRHVL